MSKEKLTVVYHDDYLNWLLGPGDGSHPTNPIRAKLATEMLVEQLGDDVEVIAPFSDSTEEADLAILKETHSQDYVAEVLDGISSQWNGTKPIMGDTAFKMFRGTIRAVEKILSGVSKVVFNPQGAKHHAKTSSASGFCVFNDMAYAAKAFQNAGLRPLYLDWDIHAGDGVAHMLRGSGVPCIRLKMMRLVPLC